MAKERCDRRAVLGKSRDAPVLERIVPEGRVRRVWRLNQTEILSDALEVA